MKIMNENHLSLQTLLQNKRVSILVTLILILFLFIGFQKFWKGGIKSRSPLSITTDTNGEIQEIVKRSSILVNGGKIEEAIVLLNETLHKYPNQQDVLLQLGMAHRKSKSYLQSEQIYQQAIQYDPECIDCMNNLAVTLMMNGKVERAVALLTAVNQKKPDYPEAYFNLAVAYEKTGQIKNAVNSYQKYLQLVSLSDSRQEPAIARERARRLQEGMAL